MARLSPLLRPRFSFVSDVHTAPDPHLSEPLPVCFFCFFCIYIFMLVFHEKWNIILLEAANEAVFWCREPMIRGVVVKGYGSVQETARRWGVSIRRVNQYALEGRIPGAERLGRSWAIPEDAVKPVKHRSGPKPKETSERSGRKK